MSVPTQPTTTTIATEAYQLYARRNPTAAEITRVGDAGIEIIKSDLMDEGWNWDFLREITFQPLTVGVSKYQSPTDFRKLISIRLLDGVSRGTAQAGASTTITLASTDGAGSDCVGKDIIITGGTGANQRRQIKSFVTATKVATIDTAWTTPPDTTSTYLIVDIKRDIDLETVYTLPKITQEGLPGTPSTIWHEADSTEGDYLLDKSPDKIYVLEIHYYIDILKMDTDTSTNPRYARVLRLLNGLFIQGVYTWLCQNDSRYTLQRQIYQQKMNLIKAQHLYPNNESTLSLELDY